MLIAYTTMGELVAWIIGWALIMEYALGAATVSIAWSEYLNKLFGGQIPYEWCHSPFESFTDSAGVLHSRNNECTCISYFIITYIITNKRNTRICICKYDYRICKSGYCFIIYCIGWQFIDGANHTPYLIPEGTPPVTDSAGKVMPIIVDGINMDLEEYSVEQLLYFLPLLVLML